MVDRTQCPRCHGRGDCYRYPKGRIVAYTCPRCRGTGEIPRRDYVIQGPNARWLWPNKRGALRIARDIARLLPEGCTATVYAPQCAFRVAVYQHAPSGRVVKMP